MEMKIRNDDELFSKCVKDVVRRSQKMNGLQFVFKSNDYIVR